MRYTISFRATDKKLLRFIEDKRRTQSFSSYIRTLIENDMSNQSNHQMDEIYQYLLDRLKTEGYTVKNTAVPRLNNFIEDEEKDLIFDLF